MKNKKNRKEMDLRDGWRRGHKDGIKEEEEENRCIEDRTQREN